MLRRRVIAFLIEQDLLPGDRAEMLLSWKPPGSASVGLAGSSPRSASTSTGWPATSCATRSRHEDALRTGGGERPLPLAHEQETGWQLRRALAQRLYRRVTQHIADRGFQLGALLRLVKQGSRRPGKTGAGTGPGRRGTDQNGSSTHLRPVAPVHCQDMGIRPLDLRRLRGRDESRLLHRRPPRCREDSASS
jgi:hypothetical protein